MPKDDIKSLLDNAKAELKGVVRPRQTTLRDGVLDPSEGSAAHPPVPRPRPKASPAEPTVIVEPVSFGEREAPTVPARPQHRPPLVRGDYPSLPPEPELPAMTPSVMASVARVPLGRLLVVIAASGAAITGVVAAIGAAVVNVIVALRPPSNASVEQKLQAIETRVNGDFGMKLETQTRQEKDAELLKKIEGLERAQTELESRVVVKVEPGRGAR